MNTVSVKIDIKDRQTGKGYWHFNNTLLNDPIYADRLEGWWGGLRSEKRNFADISNWWDAGKLMIQKNTCQYCTEKRRQMELYVNATRKRLRYLERKPQGFELQPLLLAHLRSVIRSHEREQADTAKTRLHIQDHLEGEKCTKYFFSLEKSLQANPCMPSLRKDGQTLEDPQDILQEVCWFYQNLYSEESKVESDLDLMLNKINKKVSPQAKLDCDARVSLEDMTASVRSMKSGKSPGTDGLTSDFYKAFWEILGKDLHDTMSFCLDRGEMTPTQRHAVIT